MSTLNFKNESQPTTETSNIDIIITSTSLETVEVPEITAEHENGEESIPKENPTSACAQTSTHLISYPMVKETVDFVDSIPIAKAVKDSTISVIDPAVKFVANQTLVKPIIKTVDSLGDRTLTAIETITPGIKTITFEGAVTEIEAPFKKTGEAISSSVTAANDALDQHVVSPSVKIVHDFRSFYNEHLYDTKGKPLLRSSLDPIFKPLNNSIEDFTQKNLPETKPITKEFSSEIEKNVHLSADLVQRSIPVINHKIASVALAPYNYTKHALDVFNDNLQNQKEKNIVSGSILATYNSSKDLVSEAWTETAQVFNRTFETKKAGEVKSESQQGVLDEAIEQAVSKEQAELPVVEAN